MSLSYLKALFIYFKEPILTIGCILFVAFLLDYFFKRQRQNLSITLHDGGVELLKWFAAALMVVDHVNKFLLGAEYELAFIAGRVVMPIFALVFAYNLARRGSIPRVGSRLFIFGLLSCIPLFLIQPINNWLPLNILFTFLIGVLILQSIEAGGRWWPVAFCLFIVGGALVEYWWPGLAIFVGGYYLFRKKSVLAGSLVIIGLFYLSMINGSHWAFLSLLIFAAALVPMEIQRRKWFFYVFYPAHLLIIYFISFVL